MRLRKNVIESVFEIDFRTGKYTTVFTAATQTSPYGEQSWNAFADRFAGNYSVSGRKDELERALSLENIKMALSADGKYHVYGGKIPGKEQKGYKELIFTSSENPEVAILSIIDFSCIADVYDALVNDRSYKKAIPGETALKMIFRGDCGCFNPVLIEECLNDIKEKLTLDIYG